MPERGPMGIPSGSTREARTRKVPQKQICACPRRATAKDGKSGKTEEEEKEARSRGRCGKEKGGERGGENAARRRRGKRRSETEEGSKRKRLRQGKTASKKLRAHRREPMGRLRSHRVCHMHSPAQISRSSPRRSSAVIIDIVSGGSRSCVKGLPFLFWDVDRRCWFIPRCLGGASGRRRWNPYGRYRHRYEHTCGVRCCNLEKASFLLRPSSNPC